MYRPDPADMKPRRAAQPASRLRAMKLEPRLLFDGAAAIEVLQATEPQAVHAPDTVTPAATDLPLFQLATAAQPIAAALTAPMEAVRQSLSDWAAGPGFSGDVSALFSGGSPDASAIADLQKTLAERGYTLQLDVRSAEQMNGLLGAYSPTGTTGQPTIYLNADWLATASAPAIQAVILEEVGHDLDQRLNGAIDSPGDEGHAFASLLLTGNANLTANSADDHGTITVDGQTLNVEAAAPYGIAQIHYVPLPEPDVQTALKAINTATTGNIQTVISISATADGTVIVYDQWEDGYEADINNPLQSSTQIWGDGNLANGTAPGTADDLIHAGQTIVLKNLVNPLSPSDVDYDGRDKIGSSKAIAITKAGWSSTPGTVLAGAVSLIDAGNAGKDYVIPFGQNVDTLNTLPADRLFEYTSLHIIATADGTTVNIDKDANGVFETTMTLNQGQTYMVNGGVMAGARITADKGIGVYAIAGDVGSAYENRWFSITPREQWANSYYAPVSTTLTTDPSVVVLYNPNNTPITVYYDTSTTTGSIVVPGSGSHTNYFVMPASAAHFYTKDNSKFYAVAMIDADATSNATHDWSYSLVPETYLTTKFVVAWGPGYDLSAASSTNASPIWLTSTKNTTVYIDSGSTVTMKDSKGVVIVGDPVSGSATGAYEFDIKALESYRLFDADKDQSGLTVYTTDGTLITAAWGEDPSIAGAGAPYLDMGTTVQPFPDYTFTKTSTEASPVTYAGASNGNTQVELSEQIEYTISVTNRAVIDLFNINIKDAITPTDGATYVAGSTTITVIRSDGTVLIPVTSIPDDNLGSSPFPLAKADGGYTLRDTDPSTSGVADGLKRGDQVIIKYRVKVRDDVNAALAAAGFSIKNDAEMTGDPAGSSTAITPKTVSNSALISVNGTADGQVFFKDAAYAGVVATYTPGATLGIQVNDADANRSATVLDTLTVTVTNSTTGEIENVTLTETGINTGIFRNTLATSTSSGSGNNNATLLFNAGDAITVDYTDPVYGLGFDNPSKPGVAGDADNNLATGNANTAYASIPVPSLTKILYLSDDSTNNLDRTLPPVGDNTAALTALINASAASTAVTITDNFSTSNYTGGSGWSGNWIETEANGTTSGGVRISSQQLYLRGANGGDVYRAFAALPSTATLTFDIKDGSTTASNNYEAGDSLQVWENRGTVGTPNWQLAGSIGGASIAATYSKQSINLSAGIVGIKFVMNINDGSADRCYVDNVSIVSGFVNTANATGTTDYAISSIAPAGQTFSFSGAGATADAIAVDQLTLSLKKTGTTAATATVSIRSAWDGTVLWSGTVSTASLSSSYTDVALAVTNLTLDKNGTYVIRVDSNASGIVWQGNTADSYGTGTRISSTGVAAAGDMRFALAGRESLLSSLTFTQSLSMATDFTMPAGGVIKVVTYVDSATETGLATNDAITATLSANGTNFATSSAPVYDGTAHSLTWTFSPLGAAKTILAGQSVKLDISNNASGDAFKIAYDSETTRSRIELPTSTVINIVDADPVTAGVQEIGLFDKSLANGGSPITSGFIDAGGIVYIRVKVADPFGDYDVSSLSLSIDDGAGGATPITLSLNDAYVVDAASDGRAYKTYEYAWQTTYNVGAYSIGVTAKEGAEDTVSDSASTSFRVTETDLGTPSTTMFLTNLSTSGGVEAGALYDSGATAYLRVTDLDQSGNPGTTVLAVVNGYTVRLTQTATAGIFEADLSVQANHVSNTNSKTNAEAAAYFTNMPAALVLTATYVDPNDSTDTSADAITINSPPDAIDNTQSVGMDKQASGNVLTNDTDPNNGQVLVVTEINGSSAGLNDTITLPSGARLFLKSDGSYIYDPSSLTAPPTSGSPVTDSFTYKVSDGKGGTDTATVTITVSYVNPIVIDNQANTDGALVELDVSGKFSDITATVDVEYGSTTLPPGLSIDIDTGIITGTITAGASTAAGTNNYSASVTAYELDNNGSRTGTNTTRSFTWVVTNVAPVAVDDAKTTDVDIAVTGNVITNDSDGAPDSDTLSVTQINGSAYTSGATVTLPHGTLTLTSATGAYTYTPAQGYTGTDSFTYTISDGNGGTSTATVNITINPLPTLTVADSDGSTTTAHNSIAENATSSVTGTFTLTMPSGLKQISVGGTTVTEAQLLALTTTPVAVTSAKGTLTLTDFNTSTGAVTYVYRQSGTSKSHASGDTSVIDAFALSVTDNTNTLVSGGNLNIMITDTSPTANNDARSITEGTTASPAVVLTGNVYAAGVTGDVADLPSADIAANPLIKIIAGSATPTTAITAGTTSANGTSVTSSNGYGTLVIGANGSYLYTLNDGNATVNGLRSGQSLTDVYTYQITDGDGDVSNATLTITINGANDAPVALNNRYNVAESGTLSGKNLITDVDVIANGRDTDAESDTLTLTKIDGNTIVLNTPIQLLHGTLTITGTNGAFTYSPIANDINGDTFSYTIDDGHGGTASATVTLAVVPANSSDLITIKSLVTAKPTFGEGETVTFRIVVANTGVSHATGAYLIDTLPTGLSFVSATPSQGTYDEASGRWTIGTINNGTQVSIEISARVQSGQGGRAIVNIASKAVSDQADPSDIGNDLQEAIQVNAPVVVQEAQSVPFANPLPPTLPAYQPPFDPALHVLAAVGEARTAAESGPASVGDIQGILAGNANAMIMAMDVSLHVLPAVGDAQRDAQLVSRQIQSITGGTFTSSLLQSELIVDADTTSLPSLPPLPSLPGALAAPSSAPASAPIPAADGATSGEGGEDANDPERKKQRVPAPAAPAEAPAGPAAALGAALRSAAAIRPAAAHRAFGAQLRLAAERQSSQGEAARIAGLAQRMAATTRTPARSA